MQLKTISLIAIGLIAGIVLKLSFFDSFASIFKETFFEGGEKVLEIPLTGSGTSENTRMEKYQAPFAGVHNKEISFCPFGEFKPSKGEGFVIFNEIAWMGNDAGSGNEWIEIKNISSKTIDVSGSQIIDKDSQINFVFSKGVKIDAGGFYLLERTEEAAIPASDAIYSGNLKNSDEGLRLFDSNCNLVDEILANPNWPAGDSGTKRTMERAPDFSWHTSEKIGGTPRVENSALSPNTSSPTPQQNFSTTSEIEKTTLQENQTNQPVPNTSQIAAYKILISEIIVGIEGNSSYEFVELYNPNSNPVDLTGWSIKKKTSTGTESTLVASSRLEGQIIPPQKHFLLANTHWGGSGADILWPASYTLAYTNNSVVLYNAVGEKLEEINWSEIPKDQSWERVSWDGNQFRVQSSPNPQNSSY